MERPTSVEAYFESLDDDARTALARLRDAIATTVPAAEPAITYGMPGFTLNGKGFVGYSAFENHYSFFPMSPTAIDEHRDELGEHVTGKGTISFAYDERLPAGLIRKVVRTRLAEVIAKGARKMNRR